MHLLAFSIVLFFVGVIMFVITYIHFKDLKDNGLELNEDINNIIKEKNEIKVKMEEADKTLTELNKFSTYISDQLESKHKELLFLYELIDEKQTKLKVEEENLTMKTKEIDDKIEKEMSNIKKQSKTKDTKKKIVSKPTMSVREKICNLYKTGKTIEEIAKEMKKGKGEIRLMLDVDK